MDMYTEFLIYVIAFVAAFITLYLWRKRDIVVNRLEQSLGKDTVQQVSSVLINAIRANKDRIQAFLKTSVLKITKNRVKEQDIDKFIDEYEKQLKDQNKQ
ncbi:hypothetical protein [Brevibacillus brevis]|uniref:hypothetical protein n=1 Tax=Brevibacillus brevis TaxID=1393 RepID=UPI000D10A36F|nr:hypothetical protein [Brevibacillus brevis]PSJ67438.1 hypothetical protein C7J99_20825 [Brevibacillus brevis]RED28422.1 hypothetical protein DES34_108289 [Brevibacillus brevis]GEC90676.1 hypothetical protein BBR01nite_30070 [Brevibacillus brevis]VEF91117.1 Uncharacterised protein [Brevibacillus brevis]